MENKICSFTGHRPKSFSFGYDETNPTFIKLYSKMKNCIIKLINEGHTVFYTGMAEGVDLWCAEIVLDLKNTCFPDLKLFCVIPYIDQMSGMHPNNLLRYRRVIDNSEERFLVSRKFTKGCFAKRNHYLVERCDTLFAVYDKRLEQSGTGQTIRFAEKSGKNVVILSMNNK